MRVVARHLYNGTMMGRDLKRRDRFDAPTTGGTRGFPPPGRKDRRKPSAAHWASADLPEQDTSAAIRAAAKQLSLPARVARNAPHAGYPPSPAFQNWVCKGR